MNDHIRVWTGLDFDKEEIHMGVTSEVGDVHTQILRQVIYLRDTEIRRALIALGWTPPKQ